MGVISLDLNGMLSGITEAKHCAAASIGVLLLS